MGIPSYFSNLIRAYPTIIKARSAVGAVSRLYLDWNSAIHPCAAKVPDGNEKQMIAATLTYLATLRREAAPSRSTFVAIDGVPPMAKMQQQRRRRHLSAMLKKLLGTSTTWDSNAISPGTLFMANLATEMRAQLGSDASVQLSDETAFGEGEHKIMQELRDGGAVPDATLIYGLDADLILLSLLSSTPRLFLMREPTHFRRDDGDDFLYLDVDALRNAIRGGGNGSIADIPSYVASVSLLGNDFLPPIGPFRMRRAGMPLVSACYEEARVRVGGQLVVEGRVSGRFLRAMLESMAQREAGAMRALHAWYVGAEPSTRPDAVRAEFFPVIAANKVVYPLFDGDWRANYRRFLLPGAATPREAAACYLDGLQWNMDYYIAGYRTVDVRRWHYPYLYGPLACDLAASTPDGPLAAHRPRPADLVPFTPVQCLAMILPRSSADLLPERLRGIVTDATRGCVHAYPAEFAMSTYLRGFLHETVPLLPYMDVAPILAAVGDQK